MNGGRHDEDTIEATEQMPEHGLLNRWRSLFSFTERSHLWILIPAALCSVVAGILQPAMAFFFGKFFDTFSKFATGDFDSETFMTKCSSIFAALFVVAATTFLLKGSLFGLWLVFGELQARTVRVLLFASLIGRDIEWFEARTNEVGTLLIRIQRQIRELHLGTSQPFGLTIVCVVQAFAGLGLALRTNWKLALVVLSAIPIIAIGATVLARGLQADTDRQNEELTKATKRASNCITNIVTVKCFNTQEQEATTYAAAVQRAAVYALKQTFRSSLQIGFVRFATTAMFVQGFWYGGTQVHTGETTAGKVVTTFWGCLIASKALEDILPHMVILQKGQASALALRAVITKVKTGKLQSHKSDGLSPQFCEGKIEMRDIVFAYPSQPDRLALQQSSFSFPAGEIIFIVGRSGSGKSTLSSLLLRFYQPQSGSILIDENAIENIDTHWLRNNITLVQQKCHLFTDTILKNISLGRRDFDRVTDAQLREPLQMAALESTVAHLPEGVQTRVGTSGASLSGGQKQRIALARARLRDTPILIMDEATSALDNTSKMLFHESLREWRRGRTTIIITHDLSLIEDNDFVYVLESGRIIKEGRRKDLIGTADLAFGHQVDETQTAVEQLTFPSDGNHSLSHHHRAMTAQALSPHPIRRDSFDFLTLDPTESNDHQGQNDDQGRPRLMDDILTSTTAAMNILKRQSTARATAMYKLREEPNVRASAAGPSRRILRNAVVGVRRSVYLPRMPLTPLSRDKPLPIPPPRYEALEEDHDIEEDLSTLPTIEATGDTQPRSSLSAILHTLWPTLSRANRCKLIVGLLATIGHAGALPAFSYALVQIFDSYYMPTGFHQKALKWSMVVIGIAVGDGLACFFMQYLLDTASQAWVDALRSQALRRILKQPKCWSDEETNSSTFLISCLDKNAEEVKDLLEKFAAQILVIVAMMVVAVIWALVNCWKLTLVSLAGFPVLYALAKCFEFVSASWESRKSSAGDIINEVFAESFTDIKTVRALTLESYLHEKYRDAISQAFSTGLRRALYTAFFFGLSDSAIAFFTPMIFWYGAYLAKDGEWSVKSIFTVFGLLLFCTSTAGAVIAFIPQTNSAAGTASRLIRLARMPINSHEDVGQVQLGRDEPATLTGPIHFINLTFFYPKRPGAAALKSLNLTIAAGQTTAIVGASGSGKSTITSLLLGLYPPASDNLTLSPCDDPPSLTLSGHDIRTIDITTLRSLVVMVPQSPVLLPMTVRENIIYGIDSTSPLVSASSVEAAAQAAGIHEFVLSLPQGYATLVGDGGLLVSGGQAQRIVIARALIRDPKILVLDEATSALDHENAEIIRQSVLHLIETNRQRGKVLTVIVVTHQPEMMKWADQVVVMEEGSLVEQGGFMELMRFGSRGKLWGMLNAGKGRQPQTQTGD